MWLWLYQWYVFKGSQEPLILDMTKVNSPEKKISGAEFGDFSKWICPHMSVIFPSRTIGWKSLPNNSNHPRMPSPKSTHHLPTIERVQRSNCRLGGCKPSVRSTALSAHLSIKIAAEQRWSWLLHERHFIFGWEQTGDEKRFPTLTANTIEKASLGATSYDPWYL